MFLSVSSSLSLFLKLDRLQQQFVAALTFDSTHPTANHELAKIYLARNENGQAETHLRDGLRATPGDTEMPCSMPE